MEKQCDICGKVFQPMASRTKRCSKECSLIATRRRAVISYAARAIPNRCRLCNVLIGKFKRYCEKHRDKRPYSIGYVNELTARIGKHVEREKQTNGIIRSQEVIIDEMSDRIEYLKAEKKSLKIRCANDERR